MMHMYRESTTLAFSELTIREQYICSIDYLIKRKLNAQTNIKNYRLPDGFIILIG